MLFLIYFLFIDLSSTHKCSFTTSSKPEHIYLCREKLNATSLRVWLHLKFNKTEDVPSFFSYYIFTLRMIDLLDEHKIHVKDRYEKQISDYAEINNHSQENNTINIHNLSPGRYEICVNFLNNKNKKIYYRLSSSCLHIPWNVPESPHEHPNPLMQVTLIILVIILLASACFVVHGIHQYLSPKKTPVDEHNIDEEVEDSDSSERAKFLVHQHFSKDINPFELLVRKRIHQRYAHSSSQSNDM
jgi:hypothetical protein